MLPLTARDYQQLEEQSWILRAQLEPADVGRVDTLEGRDRMGRKGPGNYAGQLYRYRRPGDTPDKAYAERLRLDAPPVSSNGKIEFRYLCPPGQRNHFYWPLEHPGWLADIAIPVAFFEGEKKYLAAHRAAEEGAALKNGGSGKPLYLAIGLAGVWGWHGIIGMAVDAHGQRVPVKGPIPDFDLVKWDGRVVYLCFDANTATNPKVRYARSRLAQELEGRGAIVYFINIPEEPGINGVDDYLARHGLEAYLSLVGQRLRYDWRDELAKNDKGKIISGPANAKIALELAPEWHGRLRYNEFARSVEAALPTPWDGPPGEWNDNATIQTQVWLEKHGIKLTKGPTADIVEVVAANRSYHPLRDYLASLRWDGRERINDWLEAYLGATIVKPERGWDKEKVERAMRHNAYLRTVGPRWLVQAVARAYQPGVQADHVLILEGPQGIGKSSTFRILGGEFYSADIPDLGSKDAQLWLAGVWIAELAELDALNKAEISRIKRFLTERTDHYRPPYGRTPIWVERTCVFGGTINQTMYLKDDTGARRFWPVECVGLRRGALEHDRDQLWAEAVVRYDKGEPWWLDAPELVEAAEEEQECRYSADPWEPVVAKYLYDKENETVTTGEILAGVLLQEAKESDRYAQIRVGTILLRLGWEHAGRGHRKDGRPYLYRKRPEPQAEKEARA